MSVSGENESRLSKLGFIDLFPIFLGRQSAKLTLRQNEELFSMLAALGSDYARVNIIVAFTTSSIIFSISHALDSNVRSTVWLTLHVLVLVVSIIVQLFANHSQKRGTYTIKKYACGQLLTTSIGAFAWGSAAYVMRADGGFLGEIAVPLVVAAHVVAAVWLSPLPIICALWQALAICCFLLLEDTSGQFVYFYVMGPLWAIICVVLSLTLAFSSVKRMLTQIELDEQKGVNDSLLAQFEHRSSDFLWQIDLYGRLQYASKRLLKLCDRDNVSDHPMLLDLLQIEVPDKQLLQSHMDKFSNFSGIRVYFDDGATRHWFALSGHPLFAAHNGPIGFRGFGSNITEAVELERTKGIAQTSAAISQMASSLAHDFNNYLAVMSCNLELIQLASRNDSEAIARHCHSSQSVLAEATLLSRNLLSIGKNDLLDPSAVTVATVVNDVKIELEALYQSGLNVTVQCPPECIVYADRGQLRRAMRNVMENAALAMEGVGRIMVSASVVFKNTDNTAKQVAVRSIQEKNLKYISYCHILVEDEGPGFNVAMLDEGVQLFTTTRRQAGGTGVGLAMVNGFCQQSEGEFFIYNSAQGGVAELVLPHIEVELVKTVEKPSRALPYLSALKGKRLLLIDDEAEFLKVLTEALKQYELDVIQCSSVAQAKVLIGSLGTLDFMVSDVILGDGIGFELSRMALANFPELNIIYMTGFIEEAALQRSELRCPVLLKPFATSLLLETLVAQLSHPVMA